MSEKDKSPIGRSKLAVVFVMMISFFASMVANIGNILQGNLISALSVIIITAFATYLFLDKKPGA